MIAIFYLQVFSITRGHRFEQIRLVCRVLKSLRTRNKVFGRFADPFKQIQMFLVCREQQHKQEGEPSRKRRNFLMKLEDYAMSEDELEAYLRTPLSQLPTR